SSHGVYFTSVGGLIWELVSETITPEMFGCYGDGLTDDYVNMKKAFHFNFLRNGGVINLTPNKRYRCVIDVSTAVDFCLEMEANNTMYMNGAYISLECIGFVTGLRLMSHTSIYGPGTISIDASSGLADDYYQNLVHTPIAMGEFLGLGGTVA